MKMINNKKLFSNLVLIGGGVMRKGETDRIDRWMLERIRNKRKRKNPRVLFIPSASGDLKEYAKDFTERYLNYGAIVTTLYLVKETHPQAKIKKTFLNADLIYFGGGSAELLLEIFKKFDLEPICIQAIKNNVVISGLSAGATIWGKKFLTFDRKKSKFINFRIKNGLGWVDKLIIPHFDPSMLKDTKVSKLLKTNLDLETLAIGNGTATYWENEFTPHFKRQKGSCLGICLPIRDLIQKYE